MFKQPKYILSMTVAICVKVLPNVYNECKLHIEAHAVKSLYNNMIPIVKIPYLHSKECVMGVIVITIINTSRSELLSIYVNCLCTMPHFVRL